MTDISELVLIMKLDLHRAVGNFNPEIKVKTVYLQRIVEALVSAQARIAELEARTVKLPKPISVLHRRDFIDAHRSIYAYAESEVNCALDLAGIKWESE
ncbi:hypothetical protein [Tatumella sp. UCD-D_suzukii]|uniref:hypothetical protein n=1 Tax=Tatumella sp. UCD-D_suzukii TaxID=1408192 RepID=UPI0004726BBE|nr:hypothetical protein [Tatumella sp. UCD-D_suzukii]